MMGERINDNGKVYPAPYVKFPKWFSEGMASTVQNIYAYRKDAILTDNYGYDIDSRQFDPEELLAMYNSDSTDIQLYYGENMPDIGPDGEEARDEDSSYITGHLACFTGTS